MALNVLISVLSKQGLPRCQWPRILLPRQETQIRSLVREEVSCQGAANPMCHKQWARRSGAREPHQEELPQ